MKHMRPTTSAALAASLCLVQAGTALAQTTQQAAAAATTDLEEIIVVGKFIATGASSATKLDVPVRDVPFSVDAYTGSFMKAIETTQVADLYRYMTGIQRAGNTGYDMTIRGFKAGANDRNTIMVDGLPGLSVRFGSPPTIGADHIEVVKGPASLLYGQVQPGGFVNIVSKKPDAKAATTVGVLGTAGAGRGNSALGYDFQLDSTGAVDANGRFLYRVVGEYGQGDKFRDFSYERPVYIAPSFTWNVDDATRLTVLLEYRKTQTQYDTYLVAPHQDIAFVAPITTIYQEQGDYLRETGKTGTLLVNHEFSRALKWNFSFRAVDHRDIANGFDVVAVAPNFTQVTRRARGQDNKRKYYFGDTNFVADFDTGPLTHKLIAGLNLGREISDLNRLQFFNAPTTGPQSLNISVINPVHGVTPRPSAFPLVNPATPQNLNDRYTTSDAFGAYASDLLSIGAHWKAMLGLRYTHETQIIEELKVPNTPTQNAANSHVLPVVGVIFQPNDTWSIYGSYSTSFVPVPPSNQDINGKYTFVPTTAKQFEGGVKADLWEKRVNATASVFKINRKNVINTFACVLGTCANQIGEEQVVGGEAETSASLLDNWQLTVGYSHLNGKVKGSVIAQQIGAKLTNVPTDSVHFWTRYNIDRGPLEGLGFGLGASYVGTRTGLVPTATNPATLPLPSYTVVDVGLYYTVGRYDITFKLSNLFDKIYYESAGFTADINIVPGAPRTAQLSVRAHF